jgi:hypothetical protein
MSGRFEMMEERRWIFGLPTRREAEMGAGRFEMVRRGVEGREGTGAGVIYPFRGPCWLPIYPFIMVVTETGCIGKGEAKRTLTSALPGRPKFRIFESHAGLF